MSFDLNIANYKTTELEEFFDLPTNYDSDMIHAKASKMHQNIMNDPTVNELIKSNTIEFLVKAKKILINSPKNSSNFIIAPSSSSKSSFSSLQSSHVGASLSHSGTSAVSLLRETYSNVYNTNKDLISSSTMDEGNTTIIERPITPHVSSNPSEFFQGKINPLEKRVTRQFLNIDTRFRDNYSNTLSSNFHLDLPLRVTNVVSIQLSAIEFPATFYNVSKMFGSNRFAIVRDDICEQIVVPDGNYDNISLCNYLNNQMIDLGLPFSEIFFSTDIYNNSGSGKMIVRLIDDAASLTNFTLIFQSDAIGNYTNDVCGNSSGNGNNSGNSSNVTSPLQLKLGWKMGFRKCVYEGSNYYVSEGLVDLSGSKYLYLVVDDFHNNVNDGFYSAFISSILNKNILARISLQGPPFNNNIQNNLSLITHPRQYFGPVDIQKMQVQLLDEFGRIVDLNNMDYSICLTMQTIYDL